MHKDKNALAMEENCQCFSVLDTKILHQILFKEEPPT